MNFGHLLSIIGIVLGAAGLIPLIATGLYAYGALLGVIVCILCFYYYDVYIRWDFTILFHDSTTSYHSIRIQSACLFDRLLRLLLRIVYSIQLP